MSAPSMNEWMIARPWREKAVAIGVFIPLAFAIIWDALKATTPTSIAQSVVSLVFVLVLGIPILGRSSASKPKIAVQITTSLALAYFVMFVLYLFDWLKLFSFPRGYDAITDTISTMIFVAAWWYASKLEADKPDRYAIAPIALLTLLAGTFMCIFEVKGISANEADHSAARLMLNLCNGAVLLGLYALLRRTLPAPNALTHLAILLFGGAQIAASGRDCLLDKPTCAINSTQGIIALCIAWTLLLGKIFWGLYISYLYTTSNTNALMSADKLQTKQGA